MTADKATTTLPDARCYVCGNDTIRGRWKVGHYSVCPTCHALAHGLVPETVANERRDEQRTEAA